LLAVTTKSVAINFDSASRGQKVLANVADITL